MTSGKAGRRMVVASPARSRKPCQRGAAIFSSHCLSNIPLSARKADELSFLRESTLGDSANQIGLIGKPTEEIV